MIIAFWAICIIRGVESQGTSTFTYDDNGNLLQKDGTAYTFDDKNRLVEVSTPGCLIEYAYDANNNRIVKHVNGEQTSYLVDGNTAYAQVIEERTPTGTRNYTYGNDLITDGSSYFLTDALGSTRGLTDVNQTLTDSYNYTPYGELNSHTGTSDNTFLYTGEQFDNETDNYYLRARYYDPGASRFISRDTYEGRNYEPITLNHYLYTHSNPANYVDPSGYFTITELGNTMSIMSRMGAYSPRITGLLRQVVGVDGKKGLIVDLITDYARNVVVNEFLLNGIDYKSKAAAGTKIHKRLEDGLKEIFKKPISFGPFEAHIKPEIFLDSGGNSVGKRTKGSLGVDIVIYTTSKGKSPTKNDVGMILDFKTGKGWNNKRIKELERRFGDVPIVQIFLPTK